MLPPAAKPARDGIKTDKVIGLLFDVAGEGSPTPQAHIGSFAGGVKKIAPDGRIHNLGQVRHILAATERGLVPSRVTVRFGPDDLQLLDNGEFRIWLDPMDEAVGRSTLAGSQWEPHTSAILRRFVEPGMTVLDVGANVGWFSLLAASAVGPTGRVIAVEPWSENCRSLLLSAKENNFDNIELWPFALDDKRGWAAFTTHVGSNAAFLPNSPDLLRSGGAVVVPTFRLDDLVIPGTKIDYVKLDVEGAEMRVLKGAERTLEDSRPVIVSEFSPASAMHTSQVEGIDYLSWFTERGWSIHVINRDDGELTPFASAGTLLRWWPEATHMEDLLFLPE